MLLKLENVYKSFDKPVLENINLDLNKGEILALLGLSGSGKTTLLRVINLIEPIDRGKIYFDGEEVSSLEEKEKIKYRRRMCLVFQKPAFLSGSVFDNIAYGLKIRKVNKREIKKRVKEALEIVGLEGYERRNAKKLSAGEAQRVAIARAIVLEPKLLLLDEPTSNLDPKNTETIENLVLRINKEKNVAIIIATHDQAQAIRLANRIAVINRGVIEQIGTKEDVFFNPRTVFVARFFGMKNIFKGTANGSTIKTENFEIKVNFNVNGEVYFGIRPEDVMIVREGSKKENMIDVEIEEISLISGAICEIVAKVNNEKIFIHAPRHVVDVMGIKNKKRIRISLKSEAIKILST